jgi:hypothetical protein
MVSFLAHALAIAGERAEAERLLDQLLQLRAQPHLDIARVFLGLRNSDEALRWLEGAVTQRGIQLLTIPADRRFDWLRPHPRFQEFLRRMSLQV